MEDIGKAFTYMFEDEDWVTKIVVGGVFVLLSGLLIGVPFVAGYSIETLRNVAEGNPRPLPRWTNLGDKFILGLVIIVALIIWYIPFIVIVGAAGAVGGLAGVTDSAGLGGFAALLNCLGNIYNLFVAFISPAIFISYSEKGTLGSAFDFGRIFGIIGANVGNYVVVFLLTIVAGIIAALGLIAFCIGVLFTVFWSQLVQAGLYGKLRRSLPPAPGVMA